MINELKMEIEKYEKNQGSLILNQFQQFFIFLNFFRNKIM